MGNHSFISSHWNAPPKAISFYAYETSTSLCILILSRKSLLLESPRPSLTLKRLAQELMIRKCEGAKTKSNCWVWELLRVWTINLPWDRITELKVLWKTENKGWHTFLSCFYRKQTPLQVKTADGKNIDSKLVETRRLMMLETSPWCQPVWELCMSWSHTLQPPPSHWPFNPPPWKPMGNVDLWSMSCLFSLLDAL